MAVIRRVGSDAARQLAKLWAETFEQAYRHVHSAEDIAAYCAANFSLAQAEEILRSPATVCKFAFEAEEPAGFYVVTHHEGPASLAGGSSELKQIYLLARAYGTGVGRALFDDAVAEIAAAGRNWVWLVVSDKNARARAFYEKLGFAAKTAGPVFEVVEDRLTSTVMARRVVETPS